MIEASYNPSAVEKVMRDAAVLHLEEISKRLITEAVDKFQAEMIAALASYTTQLTEMLSIERNVTENIIQLVLRFPEAKEVK